jgi:hypothetical protein
MTKEKTNLIKTLKDENLRAETHKYTQNLINNHKNRSLTVPSNNSNIKKEIENKILNLKPYESQEIKSINIKLNEKPKKQEENLEIRNFSKPKNDKKALIRVQRQELDD